MNDEEKAKILVVDDNEIVRYARVRILRKAGFEIIEAGNGADAIEKAVSMEPDLVLLDVNLPDISGFDVCRYLRENEKTSLIPIIHLSSTHSSSSDKVTGLSIGADAYLVDPVEPPELIATIRAMLRLRRVQQKLKDSESQLRNILENAKDIIGRILLKPRPHIVYVNPAATKILGYTTQELYSNPDLILNVVHSEDRPLLEKILNQQIEIEGPIVARFLNKSGEVIWTEMKIARVYDSSGNVIGFDSIISDITSEKKAEEERERLIIELEKALFEVKTLRGLIPICSGCKKVRVDKNYWQAIEIYLKEHTDVEFTHGLCPDCIKKYYPELADEVIKELKNKETGGGENK